MLANRFKDLPETASLLLKALDQNTLIDRSSKALLESLFSDDLCIFIPNIIYFCNDPFNTSSANNRDIFKNGL